MCSVELAQPHNEAAVVRGILAGHANEFPVLPIDVISQSARHFLNGASWLKLICSAWQVGHIAPR